MSNKPTLDEILNAFASKSIRYKRVFPTTRDTAKQQLTQLIADIIGEDLPTDMYGSWTMNDGAKRRILLSDEVIITNKTHATQRQRAKERGIDL